MFCARPPTLGDLMLATCRDIARPGVKECEVYGAMMNTMMSNGGEEPTLFLWNCDRYPYPHPFRMPTTRPMEKGDLIICEMHPKFGGYFTHVERTYCLGEPEKEQLEHLRRLPRRLPLRTGAFRAGQDDLDRARWR